MYLTDGALAFHHSAVAHAPPDTFRCDVPPGLRSAEATRAWLGTHLAAVKELARQQSPKPPYARARELKAAVALAAAELDRAFAVTKTAGLWFDERRVGLYKDVDEDIRNVQAFVTRPVLVQKSADDVLSDARSASLYSIGCEALSTM